MASDSDRETERTVVQTYVPAYQRDAWDEHAEELDMSRSEFVRTMVQAGRREFGGGVDDPRDSAQASEEELRQRVLDFLENSGASEWDALLSDVTGDIETRLDETLQDLQETGRIRYSGRDGGYVLAGGDDE